jgi:hypothetical protein
MTGSTREGGVGTVAMGVGFTGSTGTSTVGAFACAPPHDAAARPESRPRTAARTSGDADTPRGYQKPGSSRGSRVVGGIDSVGAVVGAVVGEVVGAVDGDDGVVVSSAFGEGVVGVAGAPVPAHGFAGSSSLVVVVVVFAFGFAGGIVGPELSAGFFAAGALGSAGFASVGGCGAACGAAAGADSVTSMSSWRVVTAFFSS